MRYDYKCEKDGAIEVVHGMSESREGRRCPLCGAPLKPLISRGVQILLTGRPPWAYNDILRGAAAAQDGPEKGSKLNPLINSRTKITDKRDKSKYKGQSQKINNSMGSYNAQW